MIIGVPREIKQDENRVGLVPAGVHDYVARGHRVLVEKGAGAGSGFSDGEYEGEGAVMTEGPEEVFRQAEMIVKVKEPQPAEIEMLREGQIVYTYFHFAADRALTLGVMEKKIVAVAYETVTVRGKLVCLEPMSEIAGKISSIMGAYYLARPYGGKGILAGGVAGVHSAKYTIIGDGTAGLNAARIAAGLGARVSVIEIDLERMRYLEDVLPGNCEMIMSNRTNIENELSSSDVVIGAVLVAGGRAPRLVTRGMLDLMKPGTVLVDISIDQGGCFETSKPTTHSRPVYEVGGILHYCVANMPGAYPRSSTFALTNSTMPLGLVIAESGWREAARKNPAVASGINCAMGALTHEMVAASHGLPFTPLEKALD